MVLFPVVDLARICNPLDDPPWPDLVTPVTAGDIRWALVQQDYNADHSRPLSDFHYQFGLEHARRIAWMVHNPPADAISIDAELIGEGRWPVVDGNHRLAAAIIRKSELIPVEFSGYEETIRDVFGVEALDPEEAFDPAPTNS